MKIRSVPHRKHGLLQVEIPTGECFVRKTIAVYCENYTKHYVSKNAEILVLNLTLDTLTHVLYRVKMTHTGPRWAVRRQKKKRKKKERKKKQVLKCCNVSGLSTFRPHLRETAPTFVGECKLAAT
jgi:hypothetical protein